MRDLNDEINQLFREKAHWEDRILDIGGPDYKTNSVKMMEKEGKALPGNWGYRYFGAARDLPGVRELFQNESLAEHMMKRNRVDLTDSYYGYHCEADGVLLQSEALAEKEFRQKLSTEWRRKKLKRHAPVDTGNEEEHERNIYNTEEEDKADDTTYDNLNSKAVANRAIETTTELECRVKRFKHVIVPNQSEVIIYN